MQTHDIIFTIIIAIILSPIWIGVILMSLMIIGTILMCFWYVLMICVVNPIYYIFTGKNLKNYEDFKNISIEDDFF